MGPLVFRSRASDSFVKATHLLKRAAALYDDPQTGLAARVRPTQGFGGGGEWMRLALEALRGRSVPRVPAPFQFLGFAKYSLACTALLAVWSGLFLGVPWWLLAPASVAAFYAVEVQFVFLFPLAIDGRKHPWRAARGMTERIGTLNAMSVVLPLAAVMLAGGFLGKGFIRCWCLGCLSVVIWYEEERSSQRALPVRRERVEGDVALRLLWVTDLHLSRHTARAIGARLCHTARIHCPDAVILGGDIVEEAAALPDFRRTLDILTRIAPVHVLPGNHDRRAGIEAFREAVRASSSIWHDSPGFALGADGTGPTAELSSDFPPDGALVFVHDPGALDGLPGRWTAAFAGHLHGGQAILWRHGEREYPGAWLSQWNGPRFETARGPVIVSRGMADTLPLRWACPKEVILCEICYEPSHPGSSGLSSLPAASSATSL